MKEIDLPHTDHALPVYYLIAPAEASANLARYDGVRYGYRAQAGGVTQVYSKSRGDAFGAEVKRRIMLGTYALSAGYYDAYYLKAQKVRTLIKDDYDAAFQKVDVIAAPTAWIFWVSAMVWRMLPTAPGVGMMGASVQPISLL